MPDPQKSMNLEMTGFCYLCSFETDRRSSQYLLGKFGDPLPQKKVRVPLMAHWIKVTAFAWRILEDSRPCRWGNLGIQLGRNPAG